MDDVGYPKSSFDAVNGLLMLDCILREKESKGLVLVLPDDPTIVPLVVCECLVSLLMYDVLQAENDLIGQLQIGDTVGLLNGRQIQKGTYLGARDDGEGMCHWIEVKGYRHGIPENRKRRIKPFRSSSDKGRGRKSIAIAGKAVEELFGLSPGEMISMQESKLLCVTGDKSVTKSFMRSLRLGGDDFEALFPMADYISQDRHYPIGRNPLGREPLLGFVSAADVAADIVQDDPKQKLVIIEGRSKVQTAFGSIDRMASSANRPSLVFLLGPNDDAEIKTLVDMGMDSWVWSASDFKRDIETSEEEQESIEGDHPFGIHRNLITRLSKREDVVKNIDLPEIVTTQTARALSLIKMISGSVADGMEAGQLIGSCHRMLRDLLQLAMPLHEFETLMDSAARQADRMDARIESLGNRLKDATGMLIPSHLSPDINALVKALSDIYAALAENNPKADAIIEMIPEMIEKDAVIVCGDKAQAFAMRKWERIPEKIAIIDQSCFPLEDARNFVATGWLGRSFGKKCILASTEGILFLFYGDELRSSENFQKYCHTGGRTMIDKAMRSRMFGGSLTRTDKNAEPTEMPPEDMQTVLDLILSKFHPVEGSPADPGDPIKEAYLVVFDDGSYTYVSRDAGLDKLNRQAKSIETCDITDISSGDEVVFIEGSRRLFEQIISAKVASPEYRKWMETAGVWRAALVDYVQRKSMNAQQLCDELAEAGCNRKAGTIKKWLDGGVISPSEYAAIDSILEVTKDERLGEMIDEVKRACKAIHSLHLKVGILLVRKILDARLRMEDEDIDDDLKKNIEDYARDARILIVQSKSEEPVSVAQARLGKIFSLS